MITPQQLSTIIYPREFQSINLAISRGEADWDDFSFEERTYRGWMLHPLHIIDSAHHGRWAYWLCAMMNDEIPEEPIPKIKFKSVADQNTFNNLIECLDGGFRYDYRLNDFLDWLLWGFGEGEERPKISPGANEFLYGKFNLGLLIENPYDYFGYVFCTNTSKYFQKKNGFYPTPHTVCEAMARMQFSDIDPQEAKTKSVLDACVGTGRMLLHASNYSLNLHGNDIMIECVKATRINGYLYAPWLAKPGVFFDPEKRSIAKTMAFASALGKLIEDAA